MEHTHNPTIYPIGYSSKTLPATCPASCIDLCSKLKSPHCLPYPALAGRKQFPRRVRTLDHSHWLRHLKASTTNTTDFLHPKNNNADHLAGNRSATKINKASRVAGWLRRWEPVGHEWQEEASSEVLDGTDQWSNPLTLTTTLPTDHLTRSIVFTLLPARTYCDT